MLKQKMGEMVILCFVAMLMVMYVLWVRCVQYLEVYFYFFSKASTASQARRRAVRPGDDNVSCYQHRFYLCSSIS